MSGYKNVKKKIKKQQENKLNQIMESLKLTVPNDISIKTLIGLLVKVNPNAALNL